MELTMNKLFYFAVAVLVSLILLWFGDRILFLTTDLSATQYVVAGLLVMLGGVLLLTARDVPYHWPASGVLLALSIYLLARASGTIQESWLAKILGVLCWVAAILLLYITWPTRKSIRTNTQETPEE
jgi:hypothetical protein